MKKNYLFLAMCTVLVAAQAQARVWGEYIAGGTACNAYNISVIENGNDLSILFDEFGVVMPQGQLGDGLSTRKTCNFRITMTPPNGFYLAGFRQVFSGGLIKSRNASAQLSVRYNIGSVVGRPLPIVWRAGRTIRPEDEASLFTRTFQNDLLVANCGGKAIYGINMTMTATRPNASVDHLIGGLDSVDASFVQRLMLIPEWRLCR